jgi:hypothetical protein
MAYIMWSQGKAKAEQAKHPYRLDHVRIEVIEYALAMENKLTLCDPQYGGNSWKTSDLGELVAHLDREVADLWEQTGTPGDIDYNQALVEAVDVGNMAMMVFDRLRLQQASEKRAAFDRRYIALAAPFSHRPGDDQTDQE